MSACSYPRCGAAATHDQPVACDQHYKVHIDYLRMGEEAVRKILTAAEAANIPKEKLLVTVAMLAWNQGYREGVRHQHQTVVDGEASNGFH
jgi:hypothetical protein